jgi:hypothetical protein
VDVIKKDFQKAFLHPSHVGVVGEMVVGDLVVDLVGEVAVV